MSDPTGLDLYSRTAHAGSARVLRAYSTSFGLATRLLPRHVRPLIEDIYALVRIADEVVDGPAEQAGCDHRVRRTILDELAAETLAGLARGYSANIIVHAFARTARATGIDASLVVPFFASMRRDLDPVDAMTDEEYRRYIHGSAEVVGLMCLRAFLVDETVSAAQRERLETGARHLGAAFQKINFLRDLADDHTRLGRCYFPGIDPAALTDEQKMAIVEDIEADLAHAWPVIPALPSGSRRATAAAAGLFAELTHRLRRTPAQVLRHTRVSVPTPVKLRIVAAALRGRHPTERPTR